MDSQKKQKDDIQSTINDIYSKIADLTKEVQEIKRSEEAKIEKDVSESKRY